MINLYDIGNGCFELQYRNGTSVKFIRDKSEIVLCRAIKVLGMSITELEIAVEEMLKNGHNHANFGMYKKFIYTSNSEYSKKAC